MHKTVVLARATNADRLEFRWRKSGILEVREASLEVGPTLPAVIEAQWRDQGEDVISKSGRLPDVAYE